MGQFVDLTGKKFTRLLVIEKSGHDHEGKILWKCLCDCGNIKITAGKYLKNGDTKSCGCYNIDKVIERNKQTKKQNGESTTRLYQTWHNMISRCEKGWGKDKNWYKDRGIIVCLEWHNFNNFRKWALNSGYSNELMIDRINNDGNYESENCRWVTPKVQANNKRNNRKITIDGITKNLRDWAEEYNLNPLTIQSRLRYGWEGKKLLLKPSERLEL
jgi:hypothetical protein